MSESDGHPSLVFWLEAGKVPGEVKRWIKRRGGVTPAAEAVLQSWRTKKGSKDAAPRWRAYALLAYCVEANEAPPPKLMRLLFECLKLNDDKPPPAICEDYLWMRPEQADKVLPVLEADARAMSEDKQLSTHALSKQFGLARSVIDTWRADEKYLRRRFIVELRLRQQAKSSGKT